LRKKLASLKNLFALDAPWQTKAGNLKALSPRLTKKQLILEILRPWLLFSLYLIFAFNGLWLPAIGAALATCFAAFIQMHDCVHEALGLPKPINKIMLSASALLILKSGHALRATHLRHHGRCLGDEDPEGVVAHWPLLKVLFVGPFHLLGMRLDALRIDPKTRNIQYIETGLTVMVLLGAILHYIYFNSLAGIVYWGSVAFVSATLPIWASYIPHRISAKNPALQISAHTAQIWTPVITSFAYHQLHHKYPKVPTALLPGIANNLETVNPEKIPNETRKG
jgi:fatty acid desaturase